MNPQTTLAIVTGSWLVCKLRRQQREHGTLRAAINAKKQGLPFDVALSILTGRIA